MKKVFRKVFRENCKLLITLKDTLKRYRIVFEKVKLNLSSSHRDEYFTRTIERSCFKAPFCVCI